MIKLVIQTLWFILPAYAANASAVYANKIPFIKKLARPIDSGCKMGGERILGDGKTWAGFITGVLTAVVTAMVLNTLTEIPPLNLPRHTLLLAFLLGLGAMTGDAIGSFIKRRIGFKRGAPVLFLDQLDFLAGALIFTLPIHLLSLTELAAALIITPPIHGLTNRIAWLIKLKKHPW